MKHSIVNNTAPEYLTSRFVRRCDLTSYNLRENEYKLAVPQPRTEFYKRSLSYSGTLREISNLVEFTGPRYSMALSKSYTDTRGVMKRGVSESVCVPNTSVVKNQDKSCPRHVFCGVSRNIRALILNDIS